MATLNISETAADAHPDSHVPLRRWLDGRWAILLSHADDFVKCELEIDRWLGIVGDAFARARIRPLALSRQSCPIDQGWVSQLSGGPCVVSLHERSDGRSRLDLRARQLRDEIAGTRQRFAMIIDSTLRGRTLRVYGAAEPPPSPLDLVRLACRLRDEQDPRFAGESCASAVAAARYRPGLSYAFA